MDYKFQFRGVEYAVATVEEVVNLIRQFVPPSHPVAITVVDSMDGALVIFTDAGASTGTERKKK